MHIYHKEKDANISINLLCAIMTSSVTLVVGVIGNVFSLLAFLSPIPTFIRIVQKGSVEQFKSLPFICALLNSSLWTYYGLTKPGGLILVPVNCFGVLIEIVYVTIFLIYAPRRIRWQTIGLVAVLNLLLLAAAILITHFLMGQTMRIGTVGVMCMILTVIMYGSPLAAMKLVVMTKSVEFLPFPLSFALFVNGGIWSIHSFLSGDYFVGIPNGIGFILGLVQIMLFVIYQNPGCAREETAQAQPLLTTDLEREGR